MSEPFYDREAGVWRHDAPASVGHCRRLADCVCSGDSQRVRENCNNWLNVPKSEACNFCPAQATEARAELDRMRHDIKAIITKFQAGHLGYVGFVDAVAALPYFKED